MKPLDQDDDFLNKSKVEKYKMAQALMAMEVIKFDSIVRGQSLWNNMDPKKFLDDTLSEDTEVNLLK